MSDGEMVDGEVTRYRICNSQNAKLKIHNKIKLLKKQFKINDVWVDILIKVDKI